jgi:hypothetical protein
VNDTRTSGGVWKQFDGRVVGDWIDYTLQNVPQGTYDLKLKWKSHNANRGILSLSVDGVKLGNNLDQWRSGGAQYPETAFGTVRLTAGDHVIRLTVVGKNASAVLPNLSADVFLLFPDITAPTIMVPGDQTAEATGPDGAVVNFTATAEDNRDGPVDVILTPPSGSTFPLGTTEVVATAVDFTGNTATKTFNVTVVDTTPPALALPANITLEATGPGGAVAAFTASATDIVDGDVPVEFNIPSGSMFPLGTTTVTATASDSAENSASGTFTVTVVDTTPPALTLPANLVFEATGPSGAVATFNASANDVVSGSLPVTFSPASGNTFPFGTTTVTASATDAAGNTATGTFNVTVQDTTPPVITTNATAGGSPYTSGAWTNKDVVVSFTCSDSGSGVASSSVPVTLNNEGANQSAAGTCTDLVGNNAIASFTGINIDKTEPEAHLQFDPVSRDAILLGRDSLSGVPQSGILPTQIATATWTLNDDLFGISIRLPGESASQTEQRTYIVTDAAGNTLTLVVKVRRSNRQIKTRVISLRYNDQPAVTQPRNTAWFAWTVNSDNTLQALTQTVTRLQNNSSLESITAIYISHLNRTDIIRLLPLPEFMIQRMPGLALLRIATNGGRLVIEF